VYQHFPMYETESDIDFENPRSLFKYRAFDRYALQALVDQKIWLAAPDTFNDPLDCKFHVSKHPTDQELLDHLNACAETRNETRCFTLEDIPQERSNFERVLARFKGGVKNAGICCFVATPLEPSMWAHYADGHRGFCIEYERNLENDLGKDGCSRVEYVDQAFSVFAGLDFFKQPVTVLKRILTSKARSWYRECEWRLIRTCVPIDRGYRLNARIVSVTFGLRMPRRDALTIVRLLRKIKDIQFFEMTTLQEKLALIPMPFRFSEDEV
jgi:Protein of unknown function (DUF2971)